MLASLKKTLVRKGSLSIIVNASTTWSSDRSSHLSKSPNAISFKLLSSKHVSSMCWTNQGRSPALEKQKPGVRLAKRVGTNSWWRVIWIHATIFTACCKAANSCGGPGGIWFVRCRYKCEHEPVTSGPVFTAGNLFAAESKCQAMKTISLDLRTYQLMQSSAITTSAHHYCGQQVQPR